VHFLLNDVTELAFDVTQDVVVSEETLSAQLGGQFVAFVSEGVLQFESNSDLSHCDENDL